MINGVCLAGIVVSRVLSCVKKGQQRGEDNILKFLLQLVTVYSGIVVDTIF